MTFTIVGRWANEKVSITWDNGNILSDNEQFLNQFISRVHNIGGFPNFEYFPYVYSRKEAMTDPETFRAFVEAEMMNEVIKVIGEAPPIGDDEEEIMKLGVEF